MTLVVFDDTEIAINCYKLGRLVMSICVEEGGSIGPALRNASGFKRPNVTMRYKEVDGLESSKFALRIF